MRLNPFKRGKKKTGKVSKARRIGFGWWKPALAGILIAGGLAIMYLGNDEGNPIIIAAGFGLTFVGIILFFATRDMGGGRVLAGKKKLAAPANCLIIRPNEIEFDYQKNPPGFQRKFVNDGKWYSVLTDGPEGQFSELVLPDPGEDERYYDPREFSNPVTMPANKALFTPRPNIAKTIAVGIMGLLVGGGFIAIIAMT